MKTTVLLLTALMLAVPAMAGPGGPPPGAPPGGGDKRGEHREEIRARVQQKLKTYLTVELSSRMALDDKKTGKLAEALQTHLERRRQSREAAKTEMKKLKDMVEKKAPDAQVKSQLDLVLKETDRGEDMQALMADTGKFLSVQEQAKLAIAAPEVLKGLREMLKDARKEMRGKHRRGPGGDDDDKP